MPLPTTATMRTPDPENVRRGYIQSWNAAFERRLPFDMSVNVAYVGSKTTRGFANIELNVSPPGGGEQGRVFFAAVRANGIDDALSAAGTPDDITRCRCS